MKWKSAAGWLYYALGGAYYFYKWLLIAGVGGFTVLPFLRTRETVFSVVLVTSAGVLIAGIYTWLALGRKRFEVVNPLLDIIECTNSFCVLEGDYNEAIQVMKVRARQAGVAEYKANFFWTGSGGVEISVKPENFVVEQQSHRANDIWDVLVVKFPRPLAKKEELPFAITIRLHDPDGIARPFYSKLIDDFYPNGITIRVALSEVPASFSREIYLTSRTEIPVSEAIQDEPSSTEQNWSIKRPRIGERYTQRWILNK